MSDTIDVEQKRTQIALFRYTLILPLLRKEYPPGQKGRFLEQLAGQEYDIPYSRRRSVGASTLRRWERQYRQGGFEALKPKPRADQGVSRVISQTTLDRAEALKREQPRRSVRTIIEILKRDRTNPIPEDDLAERTLRRHLAARGATTQALYHAQRGKAYTRFERAHPSTSSGRRFGDLWQGDAMDGPYLPDPADPERDRQTYLFAFLDDHTRLAPHAQFYWNEQLPRLEDCFKRALLRYGRPLAIYVDQGAVYRSGHMDTVCAQLGIQRIHAKPYYPEGKGKIERFFGFVQSDFLPELTLSDVTTLLDLNESLLAWIEVVYHRKLHSELGQSPLERFQQDEAPTVRPVDPTELRQAFLHRATRRVTKTATVSFHGNRYQVPAFLVGQTVELRYDPFDLTRLEVWYDSTFLELAQPEQIQRTTHPDVTPDPQPDPPPPHTGVDYLALLRQERERLLRESVDQLRFTRLSPPDPDEEE